jgi:hypothetical protein
MSGVSVSSLRQKVSAEARRLLNAIWSARLASGNWPASVAIRLELREIGPAKVAKTLGGSIVQEHPAAGHDPITYRLTTLGLFLSDDGPKLAELLRRYIVHVRDRIERDRRLVDTQFSDLGFGERQVTMLRVLLFDDWGYPWNTGGSNGPNGYATSSPACEEWLSVPDVAGWIDDLVSARYDDAADVDVQQRGLRSMNTAVSTPRFECVADERIRVALVADDEELRRVHEVRAWKACVILSGTLIEGMLLDAIGQDPEAVAAMAKRAKTADPVGWKLDDLAHVAKARNIIHATSADLTGVVRAFRNLVHPARQTREQLRATRELAESAISTVNVLRAELVDRATSKKA